MQSKKRHIYIKRLLEDWNIAVAVVETALDLHGGFSFESFHHVGWLVIPISLMSLLAPVDVRPIQFRPT